MTRSRHRSPAGSAVPSAVTSAVPSAVTVATVVGAAVASAAALRLGRRLPETARAPWERTNHAGRPVTLLEGPALVTGAVTGAAVAGAVTRAVAQARPGAHRSGVPTVVVALAAGALGALDDLAGGVTDKGLKGHLGALARGEVTTGALKVVGLGLTGLAGAALVDARAPRPAGAAHAVRASGPRSLAATLVGGAVVAGAANAVNLFDLRPGRALKVTVAAALPLVTASAATPATPAAAVVGASLGVVRDDLAATAMLGDTGANAAGALLGLALVERTGLAGRAVALSGLVALTLASERVSFTRFIESHPTLRRLDEWGRERR